MGGYDEEKDEDKVTEDPGFLREAKQMIFIAEQSKRNLGRIVQGQNQTINIGLYINHCFYTSLL